MSAPVQAPPRAVLSLAELLSDHPQPEPCLIEPGLLPSQGILFLGGEPKAGKSLLVANLAFALAAGGDHAGFKVPFAKRVLICQFELPDQDAFGERHFKPSVVASGSQSEGQIGDQEGFSGLGFATEKKDSLRRQQPGLD